MQGGLLFAWGLDDLFRIGKVGRNIPVPEITLPHLQVVSAAASRHSLLLADDGGVISMGPNNSRGGGSHGSRPLEGSGQLGRITGSSAPGVVRGPLSDKNVIQVVTGRYHSLGVTAEGLVFSWGLNDFGQLGRQVAVELTQLDSKAALPERAAGAGRVDSVLSGQLTNTGQDRWSSSVL
eukprot:gene13410-13538_t